VRLSTLLTGHEEHTRYISALDKTINALTFGACTIMNESKELMDRHSPSRSNNLRKYPYRNIGQVFATMRAKINISRKRERPAAIRAS